MEKKQKVKSDEIDLISIVDKVWSERRFLIKFTLVIFVIGVIIAFSLPRTYKSESKIIPEDTKEVVTNKANSFASLLGLAVNNNISREISADIYPDIIRSTPYLLEFANLKVLPQGMVEMSLYEYITLHQKEAWWSFITQLPRKIGGLFTPKIIEENDTNYLLVKQIKNEVSLLPQEYFETDIYKASREIKKMQKLSSKILTLWYENMSVSNFVIEETV